MSSKQLEYFQKIDNYLQEKISNLKLEEHANEQVFWLVCGWTVRNHTWKKDIVSDTTGA